MKTMQKMLTKNVEIQKETEDGRNPVYSEMEYLFMDEEGVGVIEIVLILVVLIGLVAVFKKQINELLTKIFGTITTMSDDIL